MTDVKNEESWNRWGAASGYVALALGIVVASFERGSPPASAPVEQSLAYFIKYRSELLVQSLLFVLSAGALLWFVGYLRSYLKRAEGENGGLSGVAFGAGVIWAGLQMVLQGAQAALALGANADLPASLAGMMGDLTYAFSVIAYVPMGVMLAAVATVTLRFKAFPAWIRGREYPGFMMGRDNPEPEAGGPATARRLLTIVYRMVKENRPYVPYKR